MFLHKEINVFEVKVKENFTYTNILNTDIKEFKKDTIYRVFTVRENGKVAFLIYDKDIGFVFIEANYFFPAKEEKC